MQKLFKWRYLRLDSQYILKLLILFNVFLGIYLLFVSTNYRKYNEYTYDKKQQDVNIPVISAANKVEPKIQELNSNSLVSDYDADFKTIVKPDKVSLNNKQTKIEKIVSKPGANNDPISVDKIYDSNNKLIEQDSPDSSYKRIEEDYKTLDENDKLRIEMMDKQGNENSMIIHDLDFSNDKQSNSKLKNEQKTNILNLSATKQGNDYLSKDVINRILDYNFHINKSNSKVVVPEAINVETIWWTSEVRGKYNVLRDYIQSNNQPEPNAKTITLTTQGTPEFLYHVIQLCDRWEGYISLSVYTPGDDFRLAVNMIYYLRQCGNKCVRDRVSWHFVFDKQYLTVNVSVPATFLETQNFDCNISLDETMRLLNINSNFRQLKQLPYPINILRNVARVGSKTKYIFASDIELYPSVGIIPAFFDLLKREQRGSVPLINAKSRHVYVVPIFEVKAEISPPRNKSELSKLFKSHNAIFFHRYVCDVCQNFPDRDIWIKEIPLNNTLNVFRVTRRTRDRHSWEPLYIGTNNDPFYDERLSWEGKRDKMSQMYEMCLLKYDLLILDNAFLVHAPGIKYYHAKDDSKRIRFMMQTKRIYTSLMADLKHKYGTKHNC